MNGQKKILILGGKSIGSMDIINHIRKSGNYVIVCDNTPKEQSPAKQIADEYWDCSTAEVEKIAVKAMGAGVSAVFTGVHSFNIDKCQKICAKLDLPFYAAAQELELASNKKRYKEIWKKYGITVIPEYKISDLSDFPGGIKYPVLLKPVDASGARGLQICYSEQNIKANIAEALKYSSLKELIAEQYIQDKEEITIVYIIKDGQPHLASLADRLLVKFSEDVIPLPAGYIWPSKYLALYEQNVDSKMKDAIRFMGFKNGMLFIQAIVKDNNILPYDMGFRLSGTQEHVILEDICGYNPLKLLADYAITGRFGDDSLPGKTDPHFNTHAAQITFLVSPGTITRFEGITETGNIPGVIRIIKNKEEGETVPEAAWGTLNQVALRVFLKAENKDVLKKHISKIRETIKIYDGDTDITIKHEDSI